jgi:uncharacterized membrane protein
MTENGDIELIYAPAPSWAPAFAAVGITLVVVGLFTSYVLSVIGAIFLLASLVRWIRDTEDEVSRMPVEQRPLTAVLPAETADAP